MNARPAVETPAALAAFAGTPRARRVRAALNARAQRRRSAVLRAVTGLALVVLAASALGFVLGRWAAGPAPGRWVAELLLAGTATLAMAAAATVLFRRDLLPRLNRMHGIRAAGLNSRLKLRRQHAQMRLLRGLADAANGTSDVELALQRVLREIGDYLEWPIGRVAYLIDGTEEGEQRSYWYLREPQRFGEFVTVTERLPVARATTQFIGRAYVLGRPQWVEDLSTLAEWNRRDVAQLAGLQTGIVVPVIAQGHVTAFIEFFSAQRIPATAATTELLDAIGAELARIAERHRADRELQSRMHELRRLALVAANTDSIVIITDPLLRIEWVNASFTRCTGYALEEVVGRDGIALLRGPATDPQAAARLDEAMRAGVGIRGVENINYAKDGTPYWVETEIQPVFDPRGALTNFVAIEREISERKRAELALRASEEYFRALFEESPLACVIQDQAFRIRRINAAFSRLLGYGGDELAGLDASKLAHPDDVPAMLAARTPALGDASCGSQVYERRFVRRDGQVVWTHVHVTRLIDRGGEVARLCVLQDVTAERDHERALREAKELAEAASHAKSQFLANMSHEIRTPMNGVLGMTELLLGTHLTGKQRRFAEAVYSSGEALLQIINDILDFSKIEAGQFKLEKADFDLRLLVEDVFDLLAPRAHEKRLELACRVGPEVPPVVAGDAGRLRQVLTNLVGNAIKFTEHGEVIVTVAATPVGGRQRIGFEVRDTGIGMPPETVARLFTVFMQADQTMSRRHGGTGLGLAISRQLVEMMGGTISVDSRVGVGSTFRFDVVLENGDPALVADPFPCERLRGMRAILAEDSPTSRGIVQEQLQAFGMQVAAAENGAQALELMRAAARAGACFDVAVLDMKMPVMDGLTLVGEMRRDSQLAAIRIVMLTSLADSDETTFAHACGVEVCLPKPVRQKELVNALAGALGSAPAAGAIPVAAGRFRGLAVLLAEDNPVNQEVTRAMLEEIGCDFHVVHSGRVALDALARRRFDLVLMDCQMPEMDGFEALRRLRGDDPRSFVTPRDVPVVALTANALVGDAERCRRAGFSGYLAKPCKQQQLTDVIRRWSRSSSAATAPVEPAGRSNQGNTPKMNASRPETVPAGQDAGAAETQVLDMTVIERIRQMERRGAARLLERLLATYRTTANKLIAEGTAALERDDSVALRHAAHTLKSSSANVGAMELARRCADVEMSARDGALPRAREQWPAVQQEFERALVALQDLDCGVEAS